MPSWKTRLARLRTWFVALPRERRLQLGGIGALSLAVLIGVVSFATHREMTPLFDEALDPTATHDVVAALTEKQVPYRIERGTDRVLVPDDRRDALRLELLGGGALAGQGVGLELFEENRFGSTRFVEHVRWVRALQGELERQLNGFQPVRASKVLLSLPEEGLFEEDRIDPSASVYLELKSGQVLTSEEGARMAQLVANAVPRLRRDKVAIMDARMRVIHAASDGDGEGPSGQLATLRQNWERYFQRKVEGLLEPLVGPGNAVARIAVALDTSERSSHERHIDPDRVVTVSQRSRESTTQDGDEQGIAGTSANLPELVGAPSKSGRVSTEADETGNYDFPETRVTQSTLPGGITSIQAAVLLAARPNVAARTEAEVEAVRTLVASSLGVEPANVTVSEQPFAAVDVAVETPPVLTAQRLDSAARILLIAAAIGCVFAFVVRPLMRRATAEPPAPEPVAPTPPSLPSPGGDEAFQEFLARMRSGEARATRENVARLVTADVAHSVATLHAWIGADAR